MSELQQFTEGRGLGLSLLGMTFLIIGGAMVYHSVMATVGTVILVLAVLCMAAVVIFA